MASDLVADLSAMMAPATLVAFGVALHAYTDQFADLEVGQVETLGVELARAGVRAAGGKWEGVPDALAFLAGTAPGEVFATGEPDRREAGMIDVEGEA